MKQRLAKLGVGLVLALGTFAPFAVTASPASAEVCVSWVTKWGRCSSGGSGRYALYGAPYTPECGTALRYC